MKASIAYMHKGRSEGSRCSKIGCRQWRRLTVRGCYRRGRLHDKYPSTNRQTANDQTTKGTPSSPEATELETLQLQTTASHPSQKMRKSSYWRTKDATNANNSSSNT